MVKIRTGESIEKMGWRLIRIRKALKAFKEFGFTTFKKDDWFIEDDKPRKEYNDGKAKSKEDTAILQHEEYSWVGVAEVISDVAKLGLNKKQLSDFGERLRRFVEGTPWNEGKGENRVRIGTDYPGPKLMGAVELFLTYHDPSDPDHAKPLFSSEYLTVYSPELQAPLHLQEFLNDGAGGQCYFTPGHIDGQYIATLERDSDISRYCLNLKAGESDGLLKTQLVEEVFRTDEIPDDQSLLFDLENLKPEQNPVAYSGWGVVTPEDNIYLFFNNLVTEENHLLLTLAMDDEIYDDIETPIQKFIVINHNLPLLFNASTADDATLLNTVSSETEKKLLAFHRA